MSDLDEQCAESMGWVRRYSPDPTIYAWERPDGERITMEKFSQCITADFILDEVKRRGFQDRFLWKLSAIFEDMGLPYPEGSMPPVMWQFLTATPEQIKLAFVRLMRHERP